MYMLGLVFMVLVTARMFSSVEPCIKMFFVSDCGKTMCVTVISGRRLRLRELEEIGFIAGRVFFLFVFFLVTSDMI